MEVFEHEHERSRRTQGDEEAPCLPEEVRLARRFVEAGDGRGVGEGLTATGDLDPRAIWRGVGPVVTVAGENVRAHIRRLAAEHIREGGLPDAGLTINQDEAAPTTLGGRQPVVEEGEFAVAPD